MSDPLITVVNSGNGSRTSFPYNRDDTVSTIIAELLNGGFLQPSRAGYSISLQPGGQILDVGTRLVDLSIISSSSIEIAEKKSQIEDNGLIPGVQIGRDREQQTPCVLVLDHSGSMATHNKIDHLNSALHVFSDHLSKHENTRRRVKLLLVKCGGIVQKSSDWMDAADFRPPTLTPQGDTPLGKAVSLALDEIELLKARYKRENRPYTRPIMIVMTDGQPTDAGWEAAAQRAQASMAGKHVQVWPVPILAVGDTGASPETLRRFKTADGPMMAIKSADNFGEFFEFLESALKAASISAPGDNPEVAVYKNDPDSPKIQVMT